MYIFYIFALTQPVNLKIMKKAILIIIIATIFNVGLFAQTIYVITVIDRYSNIAESCEVDFNNIKEIFTNISNDVGMELKIYDTEFDQAQTISFINNFTCSPDDVVFFYYSGHGFRYSDQDNNVWPYLNVCQEGQSPEECGVDINWVHQQLIEKNPRLSIAIGDCCNNQIDWLEPRNVLSRSTTYKSNNTADGYEKLFGKSSGHIIASGSIPGQYSLGTQTGGLFTNGIIDALKKARGIETITWKNIFEKAQNYTLNTSNSDQKPHYLLQMPSGNLYSEGEYPELDEIVDIPDQDDEWIEPDEWEDDGNWEDEYADEESTEQILYDLGIIFMFGITFDDDIISDNEYDYLYDYFDIMLAENGYDESDTELFFTYLGEEIEDLEDYELYDWLDEAIIYLYDTYGEEEFLLYFDDLATIADHPESEGYDQFLDYVITVLEE